MKQSLILLTLFCSTIFNLQSQDLSTFYKLSNESIHFNSGQNMQYILTSSSQRKNTIRFDAKTEFPIDIDFEIFMENGYSNDLEFLCSFGKKQKTVFKITGSKDIFFDVFQNGEERTQLHAEENKKGKVLTMPFRINPNSISWLTNEMGDIYPFSFDEIDSHDFSIQLISGGTVGFRISVNTEAMPRLSNFAKNGLSLYAIQDISKGRIIGSIPYGAEVIVLEEKMEGNPPSPFHYSNDTKGSLKQNGISSKMMKVLYKNQVGYAFGGYLLPFKWKTQNDRIGQNGWDIHSFGDEVFYKDELMYKRMMFDFSDEKFKMMSTSQIELFVNTLFPDDLPKETIAEILESESTHHILQRRENNLAKTCKVVKKGGQLISVSYIDESLDLSKNLQSITRRYVTASKLNMRASSDPQSSILTKIPFGIGVDIMDAREEFQLIGGKHGKMIKVKYNNQIGYVFDAYLSSHKPMETTNGYSLTEEFNKYIKENTSTEWTYNIAFQPNQMCSQEKKGMILMCRDKFQALNTFKKACPFINDISFKWYEDEDGSGYGTKVNDNLMKYHNKYNTHTFTKFLAEDIDEGYTIIIEELNKGLYRVTLFEVEAGC